MTRFFGVVGYGTSAETPPGSGVWRDVITEESYYGDVTRVNRKLEPGENLNNDISVQNSISIVADQFMVDNFMNIRYVEWSGIKWKVSGVQLKRPRLILTLGNVYNGPIPIPED